MKVYIVEEGSYEDAAITEVHSSLDRAQADLPSEFQWDEIDGSPRRWIPCRRGDESQLRYVHPDVPRLAITEMEVDA